MRFDNHKSTIITFCFLLLVSAPLVDMVLKLDQFKEANENRPLSKFPPLHGALYALQIYPLEFNKYFNDNFGFRNSLVRANFFLKYKLLSTSTSREVVIGKDGWLFFAGDGELDDFRGISRYDETTLSRLATFYEMKRNWLSKKGIRYLFVIAPNKSSIYREFLPKFYNGVSNKTDLDKLVEYLNKHTKVEVVDLRPSLIAAKPRQRLYHKTDAHWNYYGAFVAYQNIMRPIERWFPELQSKSIDSYTIKKVMGGGTDSAILLGGTEFIKEEFINLEPLNHIKVNLDGIYNNGGTAVIELNNGSRVRALVFRDSFFATVIPFLTEHFSYAKYYWKRWDKDTAVNEMVNTVQPDIVIEEVLERFVKYNTPDSNCYPLFINEDRFNNGARLFSIDKVSNKSEIKPNNEAYVELEPRRLIINSIGNDPYIILPKIRYDDNGKNESCIMKLAYSSNIDSTMQLFYKPTSSEDYTEGKSIKKQISKGNHTTYINVPCTALSNQIRIDPSTVKGKLLIDELEIRAVSTSSL